MNIIILTPIIFTLALVHGGGVFYKGNNMTSNLAPNHLQPCKGKSNERAYNNFLKRHILPPNFDINSEEAWRRYLEENELCGRARVQSFINKADEGKVLEICSSAGRRLKKVDPRNLNLCISMSAMLVYHVKSTKDCKIQSVNKSKHHVIVACDKIGRKCRPVHYEKYKKQSPGNTACTKTFCQASLNE